MSVETNPFRPIVPELASGSLPSLVAYLNEQAAILREQYDKDEARVAAESAATRQALDELRESLTAQQTAAQNDLLEKVADQSVKLDSLTSDLKGLEIPSLDGVAGQLSQLTTALRRIDEGQQLQYVSIRNALELLTEQVASVPTLTQHRALKDEVAALATEVSKLKFQSVTQGNYAANGIVAASGMALRADTLSSGTAGDVSSLKTVVAAKADLADIPVIPPIPALGWTTLLDLTGAGIAATQNLAIPEEYTELLVIGIGLATVASAEIRLTISFDGVTYETSYFQSLLGTPATAITNLAATGAATAARSFMWQLFVSGAANPIMCRDSHRTHTRYPANVGQLDSIRVALSAATTYSGGRLIVVGRK